MTTANMAAPARVKDPLLAATLGESPSFRNFAMVWALASLFHMAHSGIFDTRLNLALLSIASLYILFKPSLGAFVALIVLQLVDVFFRMPNVTNHWLFTAFVNITILQCMLYVIYKKKSFEVGEQEIYDTFAPVVRVEVLILYLWAVFHKLNSGFFSPDVSCATELLRAQHLDFILSAFPQLIWLNAYFTIVVELAILVMLCLQQTRNAAVLLGFVFHLVLSFSTYNAFFDFTSMVIAVYFLFTTSGFNHRAYQWWKNTAMAVKLFFSTYSGYRFAAVCGLVLVLVGVISILNKVLHDFRLFHLYFFWTLYCLILTYVFVRFLFVRNERTETQKLFAFRSSWFLILPVIVFLNGTSPYLGLKTENSYAMFSNLRTEGGVTNHYIVPAKSQIFGFQSDLVEIISSDDAKLQRLAEQQQLMVLFEFRNYLHKYNVDEVVYRLNGKQEVFRKGETEVTANLKPDSFLLTRLMNFRTISKADPQPCAH